MWLIVCECACELCVCVCGVWSERGERATNGTILLVFRTTNQAPRTKTKFRAFCPNVLSAILCGVVRECECEVVWWWRVCMCSAAVRGGRVVRTRLPVETKELDCSDILKPSSPYLNK